MNTTQPLINYLVEHDFLTKDEADRIGTETSFEAVRSSLQESGLLSFDQVERLESLFSGFPLNMSPAESVDASFQNLIPYPLSHKHRVVCFDSQDGGLCVVTDQATIAEEINRKHDIQSVQRVSPDHVDRYLEQYHRIVREELLQSILYLSRQVRTIESYGSQSMAMFFPEDHQQEIAEDISSLRLLRRIMEMADLYDARSVTIRTKADKITVSIEHSGEWEDIVDLDKKLEGALYLKLRYLSDLPLRGCETIEQGTAQGLFTEYNEACLVTFTPHALGMTMTILNGRTNQETFTLEQSGFNNRDIDRLLEVKDKGRGLVLTSGISQSGKTFATYHVLEAFSHTKQVGTLEENVEYIIDGVDQITFSRRPEKDMRDLAARYNVLGILPLRSGLVQSAYNQAANKVVVAETVNGVMGVITQLVSLGVTAREVVERIRYNIVSYRFETVKEGKGQEYRLNSGEQSTIEQFCSIQSCNEALREAGLEEVSYEHWSDVVFTTNTEYRRAWWYWRSIAHQLADEPHYTYVRGVVDISELIYRSQKRGDSIKEVEHTIKQEQKMALARQAIVGSIQGEIDIMAVVNMLRA